MPPSPRYRAPHSRDRKEPSRCPRSVSGVTCRAVAACAINEHSNSLRKHFIGPVIPSLHPLHGARRQLSNLLSPRGTVQTIMAQLTERVYPTLSRRRTQCRPARHWPLCAFPPHSESKLAPPPRASDLAVFSSYGHVRPLRQSPMHMSGQA